MSVVVRMEMPKSCRECLFMTGCSFCEGYSDSCVLAPDGVECEWDFSHGEGPTKRPDWCPLQQLVRCNDCMFYDRQKGKCEKNLMDYGLRIILPNWFCADAIRRDEG